MKYCIFFTLLVFRPFSGLGQTPAELIAMVQSAQTELRSAFYKVSRQDTFVTGQTRLSTGGVKIKVISEDTLFGFAYWGKKDGINSESIYDGKSYFYINNDKQEYDNTSNASSIKHSLGSPGGQMVVPDFVRLDTVNAVSFSVTNDKENYYLVIHLPDIRQYNVEKRVKSITIDKRLLLPVAIRTRQETLGKIQDIYYTLSEIKINDPAFAYDFSSERIPPGYSKRVAEPNKTLLSLVGKSVPFFSVTTFNNDVVSSDDFNNKVILLDFWEVWCGPCVASMPKVQDLYQKYSSKGLRVYGMMSEKNQLDVAKLLVNKRKINFPMLQSNEKLNKTFGIQAVPTYILVDRKGMIRFTYEGFSDDIEQQIKKLL